MAIFPTRADQSANVVRALGAPYYGDRVSFRFCCCLLFHFPPLALLDQPGHRGDSYSIRRDTANVTLAGERKIMLEEESVKSKHLLTLWEFEGALKYSPFFYGWYTNQDTNRNYRLPMAYFVTNLVVYTYSFVAILRKYRLHLSS